MGALEALKGLKADAKSRAATAEEVAAAFVAQFPNDPPRAKAMFVKAVMDSEYLARQVVAPSLIRGQAEQWFARFFREMPKGEGAANQGLPQGHHSSAAPDKISAEGQDRGAREGQSLFANRAENQPSGGQSAIASTASLSTPLARPQSTADIAASAKVAQFIARTVFDSYKVRGDRPIGDVTFGELDRLIADNTQEAAVLRQIKRHIQAPPDVKIRDALKTNELERFIQRGAEFADVA